MEISSKDKEGEKKEIKTAEIKKSFGKIGGSSKCYYEMESINPRL